MLKETIKKAKYINNLNSNQAVGDKLGVSGVTVGRWAKLDSIPEDEHAHDLAVLAGDDPADLMVYCLEMRAQRPELKRTFQRIKSALLAAMVVSVHCILCKIAFTTVSRRNESVNASNSII